jgi:hypothetical protein
MALLGLLACGPGDPEIDISVSMSPLIPMDATEAVVVLFPAAPASSCEVLRLSEKSSDAKQIGTYRSVVPLVNQAPPHGASFFELVPGEYQVAVYVYRGEDLVGFGCQMSPVTIELGKRTETQSIQVRALPG